MPSDRSKSCVTLVHAPQGRPRRDIDWAAVERDYRDGRQSLRDLACKHGCSHSAIANRAGRLHWERTCGASTVMPPLAGSAYWASDMG